MIRFFFISISLAFALLACNNEGNDTLLAKVNGEKLYLSDIYIPENLHEQDSIDFLKLMVQQWILEQLMYEEAQQELTDDELNIDKEIKRMKRKLIVGRYEQKLLSDTSHIQITDSDALKYYEQNPEEFVLKDNIVRVRYAKIPFNHPLANEFRTLLKSDDNADQAKLVKLCSEHALNSFIDDMVWLYFNDLLKEIPIKTYNQEEFLNSNTFVELSKDSVLYLLDIKDFMIKDSRAPFPLVKGKIIAILQASKNKDILMEHRNKIYKTALSENKIEVFL